MSVMFNELWGEQFNWQAVSNKVLGEEVRKWGAVDGTYWLLFGPWVCFVCFFPGEEENLQRVLNTQMTWSLLHLKMMVATKLRKDKPGENGSWETAQEGGCWANWNKREW